MKAFLNGEIVSFIYTNYKGVTARRLCIILGVDFGENEWYPEPQWFLRTWDLEKGSMRSFAFAKIEPNTIQHASILK